MTLEERKELIANDEGEMLEVHLETYKAFSDQYSQKSIRPNHGFNFLNRNIGTIVCMNKSLPESL